jgi:acetyl-CoA carboxylase biotin carboxylase subunit
MIDTMGDKATAKATMIASGVPVVPGSEGIVEDASEAKKIADSIGYPVILKATAGGGGRGMRVVHKSEELKSNFEMCSNEAMSSFGNAGVYIEKFVEKPRHVEIQILGDTHGNVIHLGERECSLQRRHQKMLEEAPSPMMTKAAVDAAKAINYTGAGTVEFLVDKDHNFYFMEMNTRIQVEHPVTEEITNYDLVAEQIKVAAGEPITVKPLKMRGHAIECRINAEDPAHNFRPSAGTITVYHPPGGHSVRVDTHIYSGYKIPPHYDSMIAKLIVSGRTREEAIKRMKRALQEFILEGIVTSIPYHIQLMDDPNFLAGDMYTRYLEDEFTFKPDEESQ